MLEVMVSSGIQALPSTTVKDVFGFLLKFVLVPECVLNHLMCTRAALPPLLDHGTDST